MGFSQGPSVMSRSLTIEFLRVGGGGGGGVQGFLPEQNSTAVDVEQIVDIPACGGLQGFRQARVPLRLFQILVETLFKGFFALFSEGKKCGGAPPVECESARQSQLIRAEPELSSNGSGRGV